MPKFKILAIDNSKDAAVQTGKWKNPGAAFYDTLLNAMYSKDGKVPDDSKSYDDKIKQGDIGFYNKLLKEAYLIAPVEKIKNSPYGRTPFSRSGCKYPHHVIVDDKLVVSVPGLKAAFARAKQQGIFKGSVKEHLERHYKELGLYDESTMSEDVNIDDIIHFNFDEIEGYLEHSLGISFDDDEYMKESFDETTESIENIFNWMEDVLFQTDDEYNAIFQEADDENDTPVESDEDESSKDDKKENEKEDKKEDELDKPDDSDDEAPNIDMEDETSDDNAEDKSDEPAPNIIEPSSLPKAADAQESNKNGVRRKKLYIAFIEWAKSYNPRNTFGSIFDKDAFDVTYPFVPHELRYFYRLANPILCVLSGKLTFFQVSELKKLNADNPDIKDALIFAATEKDYRVFSTRDKKVYLGEDKPDGSGIQFTRALGDSFDLYIQNMINKGDILNGPIDDEQVEEKDSEE